MGRDDAAAAAHACTLALLDAAAQLPPSHVLLRAVAHVTRELVSRAANPMLVTQPVAQLLGPTRPEARVDTAALSKALMAVRATSDSDAPRELTRE